MNLLNTNITLKTKVLRKKSIINTPEQYGSVTFESLGQSSNNISGTSITVPKPIGLVSGNLMLAIICARTSSGGHSFNGVPSGWTIITSAETVPAAIGIAWKIANSSDVAASSFSFNFSPNDNAAQNIGGVILRFSNTNQTNPIGVIGTPRLSAGGIDGSIVKANSISTVIDKLILWILQATFNNTSPSTNWSTLNQSITWTTIFSNTFKSTKNSKAHIGIGLGTTVANGITGEGRITHSDTTYTNYATLLTLQ
jgi:hypothetical protein